jgi:hypothetical protein
VALLSKLFPGAQFIHIVRDPLALFPSTRRLWKSLDAVQGCQVPRHEQLDAYVFESLLRMYDGFEKQRYELDPSCIVDIRYEDLVADPVGVLEGIYQRLQLGDFTHVREIVQQYVLDQTGYQTNRHQLAPEMLAEIHRRWRSYFDRYGYSGDDRATDSVDCRDRPSSAK